MLTAEAPSAPRPWLRKRLANPVVATVGLAALVILVWSTVIEWEWSLLDDPSYKIGITESIKQSGFLEGVLRQVQGQASADWKGWGLFRPAWYVYSALFYLTSPPVAHGLRLAMFLVVVLVPAFRFSRQEGTDRNVPILVWALCLLLANTTLYQGLTFLSLQELTGLTLAALGLVTSNRVGRCCLWLAAAWMKTPFVWLLLAWGVFLVLGRRTRATGLAALGIGAATVVAAAISARSGAYTTNFVVNPARIEMSVRQAIPLFYWPGLIGVLGLLALRPRLSTIAWRDPLALSLAAGGLLYLANLLPWGSIDVYYGSPPIWMLSAAAIRFVATAQLRSWSGTSRHITAVILIVALGATAYLVTKIVRLQYERNDAVVNLRDFLLAVRDPDPLIGINGVEASPRLHEIVLLHRRGWQGTIVYVDPTDASISPDYYITLSDQSGINSRLAQNPVRSWPAATVYAP